MYNVCIYRSNMCFVFIEIVLIFFFRKTIDITIILYCELIACSPDFRFCDNWFRQQRNWYKSSGVDVAVADSDTGIHETDRYQRETACNGYK